MLKSLFVAGCGLMLLPLMLVAEGRAEDREPSFWMKNKLKYAHEILNGLAQEDYELIAQNANAMQGLNKLEFFVRQKPEGYRTHLKSFQFSVNELIRHAENKNLDGATLAFTQLTISCVNCHKEVRREELPKVDQP